MLNHSFPKGIGNAEAREWQYIRLIREIDVDCGMIYVVYRPANCGW